MAKVELRLSDPDVAEAAMKFHLTRVFETVRKLIAAHREYFDADALTVLSRYTDAAEPTEWTRATVL